MRTSMCSMDCGADMNALCENFVSAWQSTEIHCSAAWIFAIAAGRQQNRSADANTMGGFDEVPALQDARPAAHADRGISPRDGLRHLPRLARVLAVLPSLGGNTKARQRAAGADAGARGRRH